MMGESERERCGAVKHNGAIIAMRPPPRKERLLKSTAAATTVANRNGDSIGASCGVDSQQLVDGRSVGWTDCWCDRNGERERE